MILHVRLGVDDLHFGDAFTDSTDDEFVSVVEIDAPASAPIWCVRFNAIPEAKQKISLKSERK